MKVLISIIMVALIFFGCGGEANQDKADVGRPVVAGVTIVKVQLSQVDEHYETSGTVKAKTISGVASRVMGAVTSVMVKEGDKVLKGELLLTIDDRDFLQRVRAAEEGYEEARKAVELARQNKSLVDVTYTRYKNLYDEKVITQQEMDEIETRKKVAGIEYERSLAALNRAEASLSESRISHGFTKITSPISGIVTEKKIEVGDMVVPGMQLFRVEDDSSFRLEVSVDERLLPSLKTDMPVTVKIDTTGEQIGAAITEIVPAVDATSRTFLVKVDLKGEFLRPGLYARVLIPKGGKETILIPAEALVKKGQLEGVYAVNDKGIITYRLVRTGKIYNEEAEILAGLRAGDRIVVDGIEKAVDGGIVKR